MAIITQAIHADDDRVAIYGTGWCGQPPYSLVLNNMPQAATYDSGDNGRVIFNGIPMSYVGQLAQVGDWCGLTNGLTLTHGVILPLDGDGGTTNLLFPLLAIGGLLALFLASKKGKR